jgi:hypothetical protein
MRWFAAFVFLFCLQLSAASVKPTAPKYAWDKLPASKLESELEAAAKKFAEALKGKKVLYTPFQAQALGSSAGQWGLEQYANYLFKEDLAAANVEFADDSPLAKKLAELSPRARANFQFTPPVINGAAKETGADAVIVGVAMLAQQGGRLMLIAFDAAGSKRLASADIVLNQVDVSAAGNTPELNRHVISWVESQLGVKIQRGECSDLADSALKKFDAKIFGPYKWGREIPNTLTPLPGDIVQLENAKIGGSVTEHHTVVVYEVLGPRNVKVLHQNWAGGKEEGRKVGPGAYDFSKWTDGEVHIFRPAKQ